MELFVWLIFIFWLVLILLCLVNQKHVLNIIYKFIDSCEPRHPPRRDDVRGRAEAPRRVHARLALKEARSKVSSCKRKKVLT